ncbi:MAG: hypothetical protein Q9163_002363 [Psora crenata]
MSFGFSRALGAPSKLLPRKIPFPSPYTASTSTTRDLNVSSSGLQRRRVQLELPAFRAFATTPRHRQALKTIQQSTARSRSGPFSARAAIIFLAAGAGMIFYFRQEKVRLERKRVAEQAKGVGRPKVGGEFHLIDQEGKAFTDADMKRGFSIVYFGFTHCPDICPEELDKLAKILDLVNSTLQSRISTSSYLPLASSADSTSPHRTPLLPLFITCDPARDTPAVLKAYLAEFHPGIVGLTGTWEQIKDVCKKYRVYFSTPKDVKPGDDYLVDHSIYFYLMDPEGDFVEAIGRQHSPERAAKIITEHMSDWKGEKRKT